MEGMKGNSGKRNPKATSFTTETLKIAKGKSESSIVCLFTFPRGSVGTRDQDSLAIKAIIAIFLITEGMGKSGKTLKTAEAEAGSRFTGG